MCLRPVRSPLLGRGFLDSTSRHRAIRGEPPDYAESLGAEEQPDQDRQEPHPELRDGGRVRRSRRPREGRCRAGQSRTARRGEVAVQRSAAAPSRPVARGGRWREEKGKRIPLVEGSSVEDHPRARGGSELHAPRATGAAGDLVESPFFSLTFLILCLQRLHYRLLAYMLVTTKLAFCQCPG